MQKTPSKAGTLAAGLTTIIFHGCRFHSVISGILSDHFPMFYA